MGFAGHNRGKHFIPGMGGYAKGRFIPPSTQCPYCKAEIGDSKTGRCTCNRLYFTKKNGDRVMVEDRGL